MQVAYSPDGNRLAAVTSFGIWLFDAQTNELRLSFGFFSIWDTKGKLVAFSQDGKTLASGGGRYKEIQLWNPVTGKLISTLTGHTERVSSIAFSPDGETLASGSYDKTILLWEIHTGKRQKTLTGHTERVSSIAFSPDGETLGKWKLRQNYRTIELWTSVPENGRKTLN